MNELTVPVGINKPDVYILLAKSVDALTGGGSSSVPMETAKELLEGICYHLRVGAGHADAFADYEAGVRAAAEKADKAAKRYNFLAAQALDYGNVTLRDTMAGLGAFFKRYNPRLYPLQTPGDIDYQLSSPLPAELCGADYILEYLRRLSIEERFTARYDEDGVRALLRKYNPECDLLAINVFDIVFANAVGIAMLGRARGRLLLTIKERDAIIDRLYAKSPEAIAGEVGRAVDRLLVQLHMTNPDSAWYIGLARDSLTGRLCQSLVYAPEGETCELFLTE